MLFLSFFQNEIFKNSLLVTLAAHRVGLDFFFKFYIVFVSQDQQTVKAPFSLLPQGLRNRSRIRWECNVCSRTFLSKSACLAHQSSHVLSGVEIGAVRRVLKPQESKTTHPRQDSSISATSITHHRHKFKVFHSTPKKDKDKIESQLKKENLKLKNTSLLPFDGQHCKIDKISNISVNNSFCSDESDNIPLTRFINSSSPGIKTGQTVSLKQLEDSETKDNHSLSDNENLPHKEIRPNFSQFQACDNLLVDHTQNINCRNVTNRSYSALVSRFDTPCSFLRYTNMQKEFGIRSDLLFDRVGFKIVPPLIKEEEEEGALRIFKNGIEIGNDSLKEEEMIMTDTKVDLSSSPDLSLQQDSLRSEESKRVNNFMTSVPVDTLVFIKAESESESSTPQRKNGGLESRRCNLVPFKLFFPSKTSKSSLATDFPPKDGLKTSSAAQHPKDFPLKDAEERLVSKEQKNEIASVVSSSASMVRDEKRLEGVSNEDDRAERGRKRSESGEEKERILGKKMKYQEKGSEKKESLVQKISFCSEQKNANSSCSITETNCLLTLDLSERTSVVLSQLEDSELTAKSLDHRPDEAPRPESNSLDDANDLSIKIYPKASYSAKPRRHSRTGDQPRYDFLLQNALAKKHDVILPSGNMASTSKNVGSSSSRLCGLRPSSEAVTVNACDLQSSVCFGRLSFDEDSYMPSETLNFPRKKTKSLPEVSLGK